MTRMIFGNDPVGELFTEELIERAEADFYRAEWESEASLRDAESGAAYERQLDAWSSQERDGMSPTEQYLAGYC